MLLIIDTAEKPIIEMQRVTYENGKPKLKHYLDDIPFDYYVTVRDITHHMNNASTKETEASIM